MLSAVFPEFHNNPTAGIRREAREENFVLPHFPVRITFTKRQKRCSRRIHWQISRLNFVEVGNTFPAWTAFGVSLASRKMFK